MARVRRVLAEFIHPMSREPVLGAMPFIGLLTASAIVNGLLLIALIWGLDVMGLWGDAAAIELPVVRGAAPATTVGGPPPS